MRDRRTIKKEKQRLFIILGDLYDEHEPLDFKHPPGSTADCETCQRIAKCSDVINKLEKELDQQEPKKIKQASLGYHEPKVKRTPLKVKQYRVYHVLSAAGDAFYYRVLTKRALLSDFAPSERATLVVTEITEAEWDTIHFESGKHGFVGLKTLISINRTGRIGEMAFSKVQSIKACKRKEADDFIFYDGENHDALMAFCLPSTTLKTRKGNKLQISTTRGSFSIAPGMYLTKNSLNRLDSYDKDEFEQIYDIAEKKVWVSAAE
ncbi:hypothetical protein ACJYYY_06935 [Brochothrix campestris]|uniref:hypothetical protein n=1 Tax=Brochothrix campestris TaxID=2757 RepID=UPI0038CFABD1